MANIVIGIDGMSCQKCVESIGGILKALPGVARVEVSLATAQAELDYDPDTIDLSKLKSAIEDAGFDVR